jgi:hypothetical protein
MVYDVKREKDDSLAMHQKKHELEMAKLEK